MARLAARRRGEDASSLTDGRGDDMEQVALNAGNFLLGSPKEQGEMGGKVRAGFEE